MNKAFNFYSCYWSFLIFQQGGCGFSHILSGGLRIIVDLKRSFHLTGKRTTSMEGIRLRSDSDGSVKCAFYQGTIVSSPPGTYFARRTANGQNKEIKSWDGEQGRTRLQEVANVAYASLSEPKHHIPESNTDKLKLTSLTTLAMRGDQAKPNVTSNLVSFTMPMVGTGDDETRMNGEHESLHYSDFSVSTQQNPLGIGFLKGNSRASVGLTMPGAALAGEGLDLYSDGLASRTMDEKQLYPSSSTSKKMAIPSDGRLAYRLRSRGGQSNRFDDSAGSGVSFSHPGILPPYPVQEVANNKFPNYKAILVTPKSRHMGPYGLTAGFKHGIEERDELYSEEQESASATLSERSINRIAGWLSLDVKFDEDGTPYFDAGKTIRGILRDLFYNPIHPEFTSLQQFSWAVLIGIFMGVYTAFWKSLIEGCVDFMWKDVPEMLLDWGVFTDTNGRFPIYHYMWIVPALFGGSLSYVFAALPTPIPSQNEWIHNLHSRGVQSADTFVPLFILSTAGMASGLSLGPELPLILTSGMIGSWLGVLCKQSMLQARVLNLTAASAAIGGFFGFPMAGALFVLELPHRMGLQYFEALSPATIASIVAVLTNRLVTGNDVTGYYSYPFLNESLPSQIFKHAIVYGVFGGALGIFYTKVVLALKHFVHDMFRRENDNNCGGNARDFGQYEETVPLVAKVSSNIRKEKLNDFENPFVKIFACAVPHEPTRAAVSGTIVGIIVGVTCMFIPHVMFWGEAQLQSLIDKGRTPLPVFGHGDEASAGLVALGYCLIDENSAESNKSGFSLGCSAAITLAKVFVTGLSLGTGIVGGHFWAPLFVGCAASHFLTDFVDTITTKYGVSSGLSAYPCVALLCIMGSTHVVTCKYFTSFGSQCIAGMY